MNKWEVEKMAIEGLKITLPEVTKTAAQLRTLNQTLTDRLSEIKKDMNALAAYWDSDASSSIRANFNALQPKFDEYRQTIDNYAKFLDSTVTHYTDAESKINNNANMFK
jgi:WXG100 family type VII secretion target